MTAPAWAAQAADVRDARLTEAADRMSAFPDLSPIMARAFIALYKVVAP